MSVAGIIVRDDGRILAIQRRDNGRWEPPGGVLELDETFEAGVRREVLEETGVEVEVERLTGVYKNMSRAIVALVFRCRPVNGIPRSSGEAKHVRWMNPIEVAEDMSEAFAVRVLDALAEQPATRAHNGSTLVDSR